MRQLFDIKHEVDMAGVLVELTSAFEGIASTRISQVKVQTQRSQKFFADLWQIYSQIRVGKEFHFGRSLQAGPIVNKELMILITSEGSFSGDIDQRLVNEAFDHYRPEGNDIIVVGHHGAVQLHQSHVQPIQHYRMPVSDQNLNVAPLIEQVLKYAEAIVYYQSYQSLLVQNVQTIKLSAAVAERGANVETAGEIIAETNYIFEPSAHAVVDHLERSMMQISLSEAILQSKLAQYASRFRAMRAAREKADDSYTDIRWQYNRASRQLKDERLKEIINGLRKKGTG